MNYFWINSFTLILIELFVLFQFPSLAQINDDKTLDQKISTSDNANYLIEGGSQRGQNLFHSFQRFDVPNKGSALFDNSSNISNIFVRVTGGTRSHIAGLIKANGVANLFLINPNGIFFDANATLDIGGSLVSSTAKSIFFSDGFEFSSGSQQQNPLLTSSIPVGLQFGDRAATIENRSLGDVVTGVSNLKVNPGKVVALIGGDVLFTENGSLISRGGRIAIGSVAPNSYVDLLSDSKGLVLGFSKVTDYNDIRFLNGAFISVSDLNLASSSGDVSLNGENIYLDNQSRIVSFNSGIDQGGNIIINALDLFDVQGGSLLLVGALSNAEGGSIDISTKHLFVGNNSLIGTRAFVGGSGGNVTISATELVKVDGKDSSQILTESVGLGDAGDLFINTKRLHLADGGILNSSTFGSGESGEIFIDATESITAIGQGSFTNSGIFASTSGSGRGGSITLDTNIIEISDNARFSVRSISTGQAGTVKIHSSELKINNGGSISASTTGSGNAGNIEIEADTIDISDADSSISTNTTSLGDGGKITLSSKTFSLSQGVIDARTRGKGDGGNIFVKAHQLFASNMGRFITTTSGSKPAGNINLEISNIAVFEDNNTGIFANTTNNSIASGGTINTNSKFLILRDNASIETNSLGSGSGGDINLELSNLLMDNASVTAETRSGNGGSINIDLSSSLVSLNENKISTTAGQFNTFGNGGDININGGIILANPNENNDILANAFSGAGGSISIDAQVLFGYENRDNRTPLSDISASSELGIQGNINVDVLDTNPTKSLAQLPDNFRDISSLSEQKCHYSNSDNTSDFVIINKERNNLEFNKYISDFSQMSYWLQYQGSGSTPIEMEASQIQAPIVESDGWIQASNGQIILGANLSSIDSADIDNLKQECHG